MMYHNWGRWLVTCPSKDCVGVMRVKAGENTVVCVCRDQIICTHGPFCGYPIPVPWPPIAFQVERVLAVRPIPNRNWLPHETVADLKAENREHL